MEQNEDLICSDLQPELRRRCITLREASRQILKREVSQMSVASVRFTDTDEVKTEGELSPAKASGEGAVGVEPLQERKLQSVDISSDDCLQGTRPPAAKKTSAVRFEESLGVKPEQEADISPREKRKETESAKPKTEEELELTPM